MDKALRLQCNFTREKWCLEGEDPMDNFYYDNGILGYILRLCKIGFGIITFFNGIYILFF